MTWSPVCLSCMSRQLRAQKQPGDQQRAEGMQIEQGEPGTHQLETGSEPMCALIICPKTVLGVTRAQTLLPQVSVGTVGLGLCSMLPVPSTEPAPHPNETRARRCDVAQPPSHPSCPPTRDGSGEWPTGGEGGGWAMGRATPSLILLTTPLNPSSFDPIFSCGKYEMNGVKSQPDERLVASPSAGQMAARAASEAHAWPLWAV